MEELQEQQGTQVDAQKVINSLLRQITDLSHRVAVLESLLESK
jgi:hypothetical protein